MKADQKARGRFLGGSVQFGYRLGDNGKLVPHEPEQEAIREMAELKAQGRSLRAIAAREELQPAGRQWAYFILSMPKAKSGTVFAPFCTV